MSTKENPNQATFTRIFNAPRELVWQAWTDVNHLKQWFGPAGSVVTHAKMDLRVGGGFHYALKSGDNPEMWGIWTCRELDPPKKLVIIQSFSDKDGGITAHPMAPTWPKKTLSTTTFEDLGDKTKLTIYWEPFEATQEEIDTFNAARAGMDQGWNGTFDGLDAYLRRVAK